MTAPMRATPAPDYTHLIDTAYAWRRLLVSLVLSTLGGIGLWSGVVVLPLVQAEFGVARGSASLPYTITMIGFATGGILMGRLVDRVGIVVPVVAGTISLGLGYVIAAQAQSLWQFAAVQGLMIGMFGSSATFAPLVADISHWFRRHRGIAMAICASGNYAAGALWPPALQFLIERVGWRQTHIVIGAFCAVTMLPLSMALRRRMTVAHGPAAHAVGGSDVAAAGASPRVVYLLLLVAGVSCCVAMSMPQVHIVAYCNDLGYGVARGAEMLSLMLGLGVVSRLASGWIADRIGGVATLLLGSTLQCLALMLYLPFDGLMSLYVVSALFGLSQGGIVPSYAIIVREYFPAREAGSRISAVLMGTVYGMALGGWLSGAIYDLTGSYQAAFINGILWNVLNLAIALWLLRQPRPRLAYA